MKINIKIYGKLISSKNEKGLYNRKVHLNRFIKCGKAVFTMVDYYGSDPIISIDNNSHYIDVHRIGNLYSDRSIIKRIIANI